MSSYPVLSVPLFGGFNEIDSRRARVWVDKSYTVADIHTRDSASFVVLSLGAFHTPLDSNQFPLCVSIYSWPFR